MMLLMRSSPWATAGLLMLTACGAGASDPGPTGSPTVAASPGLATSAQPLPTCDDEKIAFGKERLHDEVTHVAPAQLIRARSGGQLGTPFRPVRPYTAQVTAEGAVPEVLVYQRFAAGLDPSDVPPPPLGEVFTPTTDGTTVQGPGRMVRYAGVQALDAPFTYRCGSVTRRGVVQSWSIPISGVLDCDKPRLYQGMRAAEQAARYGCVPPSD